MTVPHFNKSGILSSHAVAAKKPSYFYIHVLNTLFLKESGVTVPGFHSEQKKLQEQRVQANPEAEVLIH